MTVEMKKYKLGDIGEVRMCKRILKEDTNTVSGIPFFKIGTFGNVADVFITRKKFEEYKAKYSYPKKGDVLISAAGTIGRTVVFNGEEAYFQDSNIVWIENDESKVVNALLYYAYKNVKWKVSNGSTILRLYNDDLRRTEIIVPADIQVQKKIASILSTLDKRIENLRAQNRVLEQTAKTIYDYTFLQCAGHQTTYNKTLNRNIPTNWEVKKLGDLLTIKNGRDHKHLIDGPFAVYGSGGLMRKVDSFLYDGESVLIPRKGTLNNVMYVDEKFWTVDTMFYTVMNKPYYGKYVYYSVKDIDFMARNSGTGVPSMTSGYLNTISIALPDSQTLETFNNQVTPLFKKVQLNTKQIETLTTQRDTLLPLLMTGQVEVA